MIDISDLRKYLIKPTLERIGLWSRSAENLLVGTALVESDMHYLVQRFRGPALSFFQIEPPTYADLIYRVSYDRKLRARVLRTLNMADLPSDPDYLIGNITLSIIIARLKYWYNPTPLPKADDIRKLAEYWSQIYNTRNLKRDQDRFVKLYDQFGEHNYD